MDQWYSIEMAWINDSMEMAWINGSMEMTWINVSMEMAWINVSYSVHYCTRYGFRQKNLNSTHKKIECLQGLVFLKNWTFQHFD